MITNQPLEWDSDDEANLRVFLSTQTGRRFLPKLLENSPRNLDKGETNEVLIRSGVVLGWQQLTQSILAMAFRPASPSVELNQPEAYPALEKDEAWNDGHKLNQS